MIDPEEIVEVFRYGRLKDDGKPRILKIKYRNSCARMFLLRRFKAAKAGIDVLESAIVRPDMTFMESEADRALPEDLRTRRDAGEQNMVIRDGKIINKPGPGNPRGHQRQ